MKRVEELHERAKKLHEDYEETLFSLTDMKMRYSLGHPGYWKTWDEFFNDPRNVEFVGRPVKREIQHPLFWFFNWWM